MARIRYIGQEPAVTWRDVNFTRGQWLGKHGLAAVDVALLAQNPTFEVDMPAPAVAPEPDAPTDPLETDPVV